MPQAKLLLFYSGKCYFTCQEETSGCGMVDIFAMPKVRSFVTNVELENVLEVTKQLLDNSNIEFL